MSGARITVATKLKRLIKKHKISKRSIAKQMGTSTGQLLRILDPKYLGKVKLSSLERVARVIGYRLELTLVPECEESSGTTYTFPKELCVQHSESEEYVEVDSDQIVFTNKAQGPKEKELLEGLSIGDLSEVQFEEPQIEDMDEEQAILYITWLLERSEQVKVEGFVTKYACSVPNILSPTNPLRIHIYRTWLINQAKALIEFRE